MTREGIIIYIVKCIIIGGTTVGWHCYRNHTHYNTGGSNKMEGIIMGIILHYNAGRGRATVEEREL